MSNYKDSFGALLGKTLTMHIQQSNAKSDFAWSCILRTKISSIHTQIVCLIDKANLLKHIATSNATNILQIDLIIYNLI